MRGTSGADFAAEPNDAMAKVALLLWRDDGYKRALNASRIFAPRGNQPEAPADADAMRVGYDDGAVIDVAQQQVSDLAANAGKGQQGVHVVG